MLLLPTWHNSNLHRLAIKSMWLYSKNSVENNTTGTNPMEYLDLVQLNDLKNETVLLVPRLFTVCIPLD